MLSRPPATMVHVPFGLAHNGAIFDRALFRRQRRDRRGASPARSSGRDGFPLLITHRQDIAAADRGRQREGDVVLRNCRPHRAR